MPPVKPQLIEAAQKFLKEQSNGFAKKSLIIIVSFSLVAVAAIGFAVYFYVQYQKTQEELKNPASAAQSESKNLIVQVGKLMVLPTSEQPTIATVSDINKLKGQSFFTNAKNGDKVLIYSKAQKAILYDPSENKIVEVGPINLNSANQAQSQTATTSANLTPSPTPKNLAVALYNGTPTIGLTTTVATQLKTSAPNVIVVAKQNAVKTTYTKTLVIDLTGKQSSAALQLAKTLNGQVGSLPAGEVKPTGADLLVILGK
ncbi:MAG: LytR C-terminal domain-containing protein [Candidatus Levyibacteriota bacterium]